MSRLKSHADKAINVCTEAEYQQLMELLEIEGWMWCNGDLPTKSNSLWYTCKENFCIDYKDKFGYADIEFYNSEDYEIITFKQFMKHWNGGHLLWHEYNKPFTVEAEEI